MKKHEYLILFAVILAGATAANLITLKIAANQVQAQLGSNSTVTGLTSLLGKL